MEVTPEAKINAIIDVLTSSGFKGVQSLAHWIVAVLGYEHVQNPLATFRVDALERRILELSTNPSDASGPWASLRLELRGRGLLGNAPPPVESPKTIQNAIQQVQAKLTEYNESLKRLRDGRLFVDIPSTGHKGYQCQIGLRRWKKGSVQTFWEQVYGSRHETSALIFANDLPWLGAHDVNNAYTGTGEAYGMSLIARQLALLGLDFWAFGSSQWALSRAGGNEIQGTSIYLGAPVANKELNNLQNDEAWSEIETFFFEREPPAKVQADRRRPRTRRVFLKDLTSKNVWRFKKSRDNNHEDFGLISFIQTSQESALMLAGTTTLGTWGCARLLAPRKNDRDNITKLFELLGTGTDMTLVPFQALIKVSARNWMPKALDIVEVRRLSDDGTIISVRIDNDGNRNETRVKRPAPRTRPGKK